jgi:hypothetical protein
MFSAHVTVKDTKLVESDHSSPNESEQRIRVTGIDEAITVRYTDSNSGVLVEGVGDVDLDGYRFVVVAEAEIFAFEIRSVHDYLRRKFASSRGRIVDLCSSPVLSENVARSFLALKRSVNLKRRRIRDRAYFFANEQNLLEQAFRSSYRPRHQSNHLVELRSNREELIGFLLLQLERTKTYELAPSFLSSG